MSRRLGNLIEEFAKWARSQGYDLTSPCSEQGCFVARVPSSCKVISFCGGRRKPQGEICDCLILAERKGTLLIVIVELKSGSYDLNKVQQQLQGGVDVLSASFSETLALPFVQMLPVLLGARHPSFVHRTVSSFPVLAQGRRRTIAIRDCSEEWSRVIAPKI